MENKKLTPAQIGLLAAFILEAITKFPLEKLGENENKPFPIPVDGGEIEMEGWEKHLADLIDKSNDLPSYVEIQTLHLNILEELIEYYSYSE